MTPTEIEPGCLTGPTADPEGGVPVEAENDYAEEIGDDEVDHEGDGWQVALVEAPEEPGVVRGFAKVASPPVAPKRAAAPTAASLALSGPFIKAAGYRSNRDRDGGRGVRLIALHTAEGARDEQELGRFFANNSGGSSNGGIGQDGGYATYVQYEHTAFTNPPVGDQSDTLEICGFAGWSRATWLDHMTMLDVVARWIAWRCLTRDIPVKRVVGAALRDGEGVCDHNSINDVYHQSSHWDVGPGFPWDVVMAKATEMANAKPEPWRDANLYPERPRVEVIVREGDTLAKIGRRYRCPVFTLKRLNDMERGQRIIVGQSLKVVDLRPEVKYERLRAVSEKWLKDHKALRGGGVLVVEAALDAEGLLPEHDRAGYWGRGNQRAWTRWERACGNQQADGIVGKGALVKLAEAHAFKVV